MKKKIAALQICSSLNPEENLKKISNLLELAKSQGVTHAFLPECFYSMSDGTVATPFLVDGENLHYKAIQDLAKHSGLYILGGSAATKLDGKIVNRNLNFAPDRTDLGHYDKMNLFSCEITKADSKKVINESDIYTSGKQPIIIDAEELKVGMSICFDVRYPNIYRDYVLQGANLLSISAAFTVPTGKAHWHILLAARAIENQCFVIAPAQWGRHNDKIQTFGHSLIIDPWGTVLADAGEGEKLITAEIDLEQIQDVRKSVKVF